MDELDLEIHYANGERVNHTDSAVGGMLLYSAAVELAKRSREVVDRVTLYRGSVIVGRWERES